MDQCPGQQGITAVYDGCTELVPSSGSARWSALVSLVSGNNHLDLIAQDGSGNRSDPLGVGIVCNPPGAAAAGGELVIEFDLRDMWDYIGEEMYYRDAAHGVGINHYGVDIWVEGPITPGEACVYDTGRQQRKHTRYVATVSHGIQGVACQNNPATCLARAGGTCPITAAPTTCRP